MPYTTETLASLTLQVKAKVEFSPYWTDEEIRLGINETFRVWNMLTGVWKNTVTILTPIAPPSPWITLPSGVFYPIRVQVAGVPLGRSSIGDLDNGRPGWEGQSITSGGSVPTTIQHFAPAGLSLFAIWPYDPVGGTALSVDTVAPAPQLLLPADTVDINETSVQPILGYVLHYLAFKESGSRWKASQSYYRDFLLAALDQNDRLATSALFRKAMGLDVNRGQRPMRMQLAAQTKTVSSSGSMN